MKERTVFLSIIGILVIGFSGILLYQNYNKEVVTIPKEVTEFNYLPNINEESFLEKLNSGENFNVFIWRPDCGDSQIFIREFEKLFVEKNNDGTFAQLKYDLGNENNNFFSFDITELIPSLRDKEARERYKDLYGFYYTPSLVKFADLDNDGISEINNIAEWDPIFGFESTDYLKWFYDNELININEEVYHNGSSDKKDD